MAVCPWCQALVAEPKFPCPSCGRRAKDHASQATPGLKAPATLPGLTPQPLPAPSSKVEAVVEAAPQLAPGWGELELSTAEAAGPGPDLEVPDLVVPPRTPQRPAPAAPARVNPPVAPPGGEIPSLPAPAPKPVRPKAPAVASPSFDDGLEIGDDVASLDLGVSAYEAAAAPRAAAPEPPKRPVPAAVVAAAAKSAEQPRPLAVPQQPASPVVDVEPEAAERLAAFGPPPEAWWATPGYAYRVAMRRMDLRRALLARREELAKAQAAVDDALVELAGRGRTIASKAEAYTRLLGAVAAAEGALRTQDSALASATEAHQRELASLDARIGGFESELAAARAEERSFVEALARVDAIRERAEAMLKRTEIDLRSLTARLGPAAGAGSPELTAKKAERDARKDELEQALPPVTEARQKVTVARRKAAGVQEQVLTVKNERAAAVAAFGKRGAAQGAQVADAQKDVRTAMTELGRAIAFDTQIFGADWAQARSDLEALRGVVRARDEEVLTHVAALDAHDVEAYKRGVLIVAGGAVLLLVLALIPLVFGGGHSSHPRPASAPSSVDSPE
jgi:hypothetical protein